MAWVDWYSATRIWASISTTVSKTCGGQVSEAWARWWNSCRFTASRVRDEGVILEGMITHSFADTVSFRNALMRGFRFYDHTEKVGEAGQKKGPWGRVRPSLERALPWVSRKPRVGRVSAEASLSCAGRRTSAAQVSEAPRLETPCQVKSGTVVSRHATRPCRENSRRPLRGVVRRGNRATETVSRLQPIVGTNSENVLRPRRR